MHIIHILFSVILMRDLIEYGQLMVIGQSGEVGAHAQWPVEEEPKLGQGHVTILNPNMADNNVKETPMKAENATLMNVRTWLHKVSEMSYHTEHFNTKHCNFSKWNLILNFENKPKSVLHLWILLGCPTAHDLRLILGQQCDGWPDMLFSVSLAPGCKFSTVSGCDPCDSEVCQQFLEVVNVFRAQVDPPADNMCDIVSNNNRETVFLCRIARFCLVSTMERGTNCQCRVTSLTYFSFCGI